MAPFFPMSGNQENLNAGDVSLDTFHTRLFTTDATATVRLAEGYQDGQLKKLTFVFKGNEAAEMVVLCPQMVGTKNHTITFKEPGDFVILMWSGGIWMVLETGNTTDPSLQALIG
ncbi:hypothetical protein HDV00_006978 [Rhizophlyctis rosea]|nr:hypothetical protein HDV00_006978 [Rhizophlyctis rosea]